MHSRWVTTLVLFAACGAGSQVELSDEEAGRIEEEVVRTMDDYTARVNAGDWDEVLDFYSDDPRFHWMEDGLVAYPSKAAVGAALESLYASLQDSEYVAANRRVLPLSSRTALMTATYRQKLVFRSGQSISFKGAVSILLVRSEQGWQFLTGHTSSERARGR